MNKTDSRMKINVPLVCTIFALSSCTTAQADNREKSVLIRLLEVQDCSATDDEIREVTQALGLSKRRAMAAKRSMLDADEAVVARNGDLLVYTSGSCAVSSIATGNIDDLISLAVTQSYIRMLEE